MIKLLTVVALFASLSLNSCNKNNQAIVRQAPSEKPQQKPLFQVPPKFTPAQIKVGNSMTWLKVASGNKKTCIQWTITEANSDTAAMIIQTSSDCAKFSAIVDYVKFDTHNFSVLKHRRTDGKEDLDIPSSERLKSLADSFLTTEEKIKYFVGSGNLSASEGNKFPWLQVESSGDYFYNDDIDNKPHAWHGVRIRYTDSSNPNTQYYYWNSVPPLNTIK